MQVEEKSNLQENPEQISQEKNQDVQQEKQNENETQEIVNKESQTILEQVNSQQDDQAQNQEQKESIETKNVTDNNEVNENQQDQIITEQTTVQNEEIQQIPENKSEVQEDKESTKNEKIENEEKQDANEQNQNQKQQNQGEQNEDNNNQGQGNNIEEEEEKEGEEQNDDQDDSEDKQQSEDKQENSDKQEDEEEEEQNEEEDDEEDDEEEDDRFITSKLTKEEQEEQKQKTLSKFKEIQKKINEKGVCYMSKIPPFMTIMQLRSLLEGYGIERMYLVPEPEHKRLSRIQKGGNKKRRCYEEGWVEFTDKRIARAAAETLNCTKMYQKKSRQFYDDLWNIRYLPKFKWANLTEKFAYDQKIRKQKMQKQLQQAKKEHDFFADKMEQSKRINHIQQRMARKKAKLETGEAKDTLTFTQQNNFKHRNTSQKGVIKKEIDIQAEGGEE